jgi:hypothetical protein
MLPQAARGSVYVFLINGADPLELGNLSGVRDYLNCLGFGKIYYGQMHHTSWYREEMHWIRQDNPEARILVVGFERGCDAARKLVKKAQEEGIVTDELILLDPVSHSHPRPEEFSGRVVLVTRNRFLGLSTAPEGSENYLLEKVGRYSIPTHPAVLELIASRMMEMASQVPIISTSYTETPPFVELAPTPRPVTANKLEVEDEWDFLKPTGSRMVISTSEKRPLESSTKKE